MPTYADQAASAIKALGERGGSSVAAIKKVIAAKSKGDVNAVSFSKVSLILLCARTTLVQLSNSHFLFMTPLCTKLTIIYFYCFNKFIKNNLTIIVTL